MSNAQNVMQLESLLPYLSASRRKFANDLIGFWRRERKLTRGRADWVGILIAEAKVYQYREGQLPANHPIPEVPETMRAFEEQKALNAKRTAEATVDLGVDLTGLQKLFAGARANGKTNPKIKMALANGTVLEVYAAKSDSKNPGSIYVNVGPEYTGKVTPDGKFIPYADRRLDDEALSMICEVVENPTQAGRLYGRKLKWCIFCGTQLDTNESQYYGYGPICAEKWGLEWGNSVERKAEDRQATLEGVVDDVFDKMLATAPRFPNANQVHTPSDQLDLDLPSGSDGD